MPVSVKYMQSNEIYNHAMSSSHVQLEYNHMMIGVGLNLYPMDFMTACAIPAVPVMVET